MSIKIEGGGSKKNVFSDSESGMPLWNGKPLLNLFYPVGSIYWSSNNTNPGTLFGGTWTQIKDKFVLAAGDSYSNGATGGAATVTLTVSNMPSHSHSFTPSGTVGSHTHSFTPSGTVSKHSHSFTPSGTVSSHSHSLNNHKHSFSGTTEGMNKNSSGTISLEGTELLDSIATGNIKVEEHDDGHGGGHNTNRHIAKITIDVSHTHTFSGSTAEATGNTGETAPSFTGTAGTTAETTPSFTGTAGYTGATAPSFTGTAGNTGANGSGSSFSILPPYVVKYCWERTA